MPETQSKTIDSRMYEIDFIRGHNASVQGKVKKKLENNRYVLLSVKSESEGKQDYLILMKKDNPFDYEHTCFKIAKQMMQNKPMICHHATAAIYYVQDAGIVNGVYLTKPSPEAARLIKDFFENQEDYKITIAELAERMDLLEVSIVRPNDPGIKELENDLKQLRIRHLMLRTTPEYLQGDSEFDEFLEKRAPNVLEFYKQLNGKRSLRKAIEELDIDETTGIALALAGMQSDVVTNHPPIEELVDDEKQFNEFARRYIAIGHSRLGGLSMAPDY